MDWDKVKIAFVRLLGEENVCFDEPMKNHTTFRVGGPADLYLTPSGRQQLKKTVELCRDEGIEYYIIGKGSNLLVSDAGFRGAVIRISPSCSEVVIRRGEVYASASASIAQVASLSCLLGLSGLEFASGIPGSVGGAVRMNAGAYGGEIGDTLKQVTVLGQDGNFHVIPAEEMQFGYRTSRIEQSGEIVWDATFLLSREGREKTTARMEEYGRARREKQPLEFPSAGSTFKRPEGYYAGKLIMDAGLRGYTVGGAMVSEKHCGFVINTGGATAKDIYCLMADVRRRVFEHAGIILKPEVRLLGNFK